MLNVVLRVNMVVIACVALVLTLVLLLCLAPPSNAYQTTQPECKVKNAKSKTFIFDLSQKRCFTGVNRVKNEVKNAFEGGIAIFD